MKNLTQTLMLAGLLATGASAQAATLGTDYYPEPDPEETLTAFPTEIYLTFTQGVEVADADNSFATISGPGEYFEYCYMQAADDCVFIEVEVPGTENGEYTVKIADGLLNYANGASVGEVKFTYNVEMSQDEPQEVNFTVSPDPAETLPELSGTVSITFPKSELKEGVYWFGATPKVTIKGVDNDVLQTTELHDTSSEWVVEFTVDPAITEPGLYNVQVEGSKILNASNDKPLGDFAFTYSVGGGTETGSDVNVTVTPDPEVPQATLAGRVDLAFSKDDHKEGIYWLSDDAPAVTIEGVDSDFKQSTLLEFGTTDWTAFFMVDPAITEAGQYKVTVDGTKISDAISDEPVGEFSFIYTLTGGSEGPVDTQVTINPAEGVVESLEEFVVTYGGATNVMVNSQAGPSDYPYLADEAADGTLTKRAQCYGDGAVTGNVVGFHLLAPFNTPGRYAIVIPKTYLKVDGQFPEEEYVFHYTIEGEVLDYGYTIDPQPGRVDALESITVTFTGVESIERNRNAFPGVQLTKVDEDGNALQGCGVSITDIDAVSFKVSPYYPIDEDGIYRLTIPADYVTMTGANGETAKNAKITELYYLNVEVGVDNVAAESGKAEYLDLTGRRVQSPKSGIYVKVQDGNATKVVL